MQKNIFFQNAKKKITFDKDVGLSNSRQHWNHLPSFRTSEIDTAPDKSDMSLLRQPIVLFCFPSIWQVLIGNYKPQILIQEPINYYHVVMKKHRVKPINEYAHCVAQCISISYWLVCYSGMWVIFVKITRTAWNFPEKVQFPILFYRAKPSKIFWNHKISCKLASLAMSLSVGTEVKRAFENNQF